MTGNNNVTTTTGFVFAGSNDLSFGSGTLSSTVQYRIYFELNGNVYTGALTKDGQVLGGSYWVSNPGAPSVIDRLTFLPFQIRLNKAARDSIASAMQI